MSCADRENEPEDLFDAMCRLDDLADWLREDYADQARQLDALSDELKSFIVLRLVLPEGDS